LPARHAEPTIALPGAGIDPEKFAAVQMLDVHIPTTDGRQLILTRYTQPEPELMLLLDKLAFEFPAHNHHPRSPPTHFSAIAL
jgi:hypothetical protein